MRLVKCSHVFKLSTICWITEVHETVEQNSLSFSLIRLLGLFKQKHWWLKSNKSCFNRFVNCITFLYDYFCMYRYCSTVTMVLTAIPLNHPALTTCNRWDWYSLIIYLINIQFCFPFIWFNQGELCEKALVWVFIQHIRFSAECQQCPYWQVQSSACRCDLGNDRINLRRTAEKLKRHEAIYLPKML